MPDIDYYLTPVSPWAYLGHARFEGLVARFGLRVRVMPCDLRRVFSVSGGLPLAQRAAQRQSYRLLELRRFSKALGVPLNLNPRYFPVSGDPAALVLLAAAEVQSAAQVLALSGAIGRAVWLEERDVSDLSTLQAIASEMGLDGHQVVARSQTEAVERRYQEVTDEAIAAEIFGAPTWVFAGERYWGQDRLDLLEHRLAEGVA